LNINEKDLKLQHHKSNNEGQYTISDPTTALGREEGSRNENILGEPSNLFELSGYTRKKSHNAEGPSKNVRPGMMMPRIMLNFHGDDAAFFAQRRDRI
jgi:hypothetical protein